MCCQAAPGISHGYLNQGALKLKSENDWNGSARPFSDAQYFQIPQLISYKNEKFLLSSLNMSTDLYFPTYVMRVAL